MPNKRRIHFIGIGGVGMNGLAQLALHAGYEVSGSDRGYTPDSRLFHCLESLGVRFHPQDGAGLRPDIDQVVYSTAIEPDNPDLLAARKLHIPLLHRAEFLKQLIGDAATLIAVAGTAGKTTTTGMLGWIFEAVGLNPTVYNGAAVLNWKSGVTPGNVRRGSSDLWIIEADESDKSCLHFNPTHTIITNVSQDHYELDELHQIFDQLRRQTKDMVLNGADLPLVTDQPNTFVFDNLEFEVPIVGRHNLENALCAVRLCATLGMDLEQVREALSRFRGIDRRLELVGEVNGITVIDDYAHNAAKISAALATVSESHGRVHAYWRPHGFTALHQSIDALASAFANHWQAHEGSVFILPVYYAGGTVERQTTSRNLVERLNSAGVPACLVAGYDELQSKLEQCARHGDAILGMGARDPNLPLFAQKLVHTWKIN